MSTALWWIRRDLRLHDAVAMRALAPTTSFLLPVYVLEPGEVSQVSINKLRFLLESLQCLDNGLSRLGNRVALVRGRPEVND
jgi:deoxyribodipyrimidine photolyase